MADSTHDTADDGFHEIQLSGKQLVFLFMATTVVSVVIFLCGVLVGRNVHNDRPEAAAAAALTTPAPQRAQAPAPTPVAEQTAATSSPVPAEPPSPPAEDELTYRKRLESEGSPPETLKPQASASRTEPKVDAAKAEPLRPAPTATARPAGRAGAEAAGTGGRPGRWVVQLVALRDRGAASAIVQRLTGKGYPAFIVSPAASTPNQVFKVQVGRYDDRNEAEQVSRRLEKEEKFHPWISR